MIILKYKIKSGDYSKTQFNIGDWVCVAGYTRPQKIVEVYPSSESVRIRNIREDQESLVSFYRLKVIRKAERKPDFNDNPGI